MPTITLDCTEITKAHTTTDPSTRVLYGVNLRVPEGEFLVIMGASESDKLTLLYSISGMGRPTAGTVRLEGRELTGLSNKEMSRVRLTCMGFVFQQACFLSDLTIRDNVLFPMLKTDPRGTGGAVSRVNALLDRFSVGYVKQHRITEVPGGQLQRASICRALVGEPAIAFADEPTGALNSSMTAEVMDTLSGVRAGGRTIIMVTHDPACAARADRVVYLGDGRPVDSRSMERWHPRQATQREDDLLVQLRGFGFWRLKPDVLTQFPAGTGPRSLRFPVPDPVLAFPMPVS